VQLWVVRPGSIGALAYVFADYAHRLWPAWWGQPVTPVAYAVIAVAVLTAINVLGVQEGKWTQNLLTTIKVLALLGIFVVGILAPSPAAETTVHPANVTFDFRFAMILILYAYGGWNEMAYVGAEVQRPEKNIVRALLLGTLTVTVIYLLVNLAFVRALGFSGLVHSKAVAADVLKLAAGAWGERLMCTLVCISALGAVNGTIFTGGRIYYAMGTDHKLFAWLGQWSPRFGTPAWSLVIQAIITIALVIAFGWNAEGDGFEAMVIFTAPLFWGFLVLVGMSLFALRDREPATPRPFRVPLYPLIPILFCHATLLMFYASVSFAYEMRSYEALWPIALLAVGIAMSFIGRGDQD
jgi:amino acid transporter